LYAEGQGRVQSPARKRICTMLHTIESRCPLHVRNVGDAVGAAVGDVLGENVGARVGVPVGGLEGDAVGE
jgi:hypothetical protein